MLEIGQTVEDRIEKKNLLYMSPYSQTKVGCFSISFFQNKNLILFPLLDSTDASRIHSDNKPRGEEKQSVLMKRKFSGELSVSRNTNTTLEE